MNKLDDNNLNRFLASGRGDPSQTTGTDLEGNPLLPSPGETIDSPWGQSVVDRIVPRYSSEAVRDSSILTPSQGQLCYILELDEVQIWDGTGWIVLGSDLFVPFVGNSTINGIVRIKRSGTTVFGLQNIALSDTDDGNSWRYVANEGRLRLQTASGDESTIPWHDVSESGPGYAHVDGSPVGVRRFFESRTLTATIPGVEELVDVIDLSGAGIVNRNNCVVNIMPTQNGNRAQRRVYGWHSFTPTAYPDTITINTTSLESSTGTGDFVYDVSIIEYMP